MAAVAAALGDNPSALYLAHKRAPRSRAQLESIAAGGRRPLKQRLLEALTLPVPQRN